MEKLMSISKTVDKVLNVVYKFLTVSFSICIVAAIISIIGILTGVFPTSEITAITVGDVKFSLKEPKVVEASYFITEIVIVVLSALVIMAVICYIIRILRNILKPMTAGTPFDGSVSTEIKKLGNALIAGEIITSIANVVGNNISFWMLDVPNLISEEVSEIMVNYNMLDVSVIFIGVLVIMLSYVFRYGEMLQQQADETL